MRKKENSLLEDVQKCMVDPIYDICKNFSLEKSKEWYDKRVKQWDEGNYRNNPVAKEESVSFDFGSLSEMGLVSIQAHNLYTNLKKESFNKGVNWYIYGQNVVVNWYRLKTFDEWLHDGLKDALSQHYERPEDGIRKMLNEKIGGYSQNVDIHMFVEWKIDEETLARLATYEPCQSIEGRDLEKDIEEATKILLWMEDKKGDVTVLTLKV